VRERDWEVEGNPFLLELSHKGLRSRSVGRCRIIAALLFIRRGALTLGRFYEV
jgi:hypothetical protein